MMFLHYLVMGAWIVPLSTYLMAPPDAGGLFFTAAQTSQIYSTMAFAGIVAPLFIGLLADKWFPAQRVMAVMNLVGAALMLTAALWCASRGPGLSAVYADRADAVGGAAGVHTDPIMRVAVDDAFVPLFALMFAYSIVMVVTSTLTNVVSMRNLERPRESFGKVRLVGTAGWIVAGFLVAGCLNALSPVPLIVSAALSLVYGAFCWFGVPHTPPGGRDVSLGDLLGLPALAMLRDRSFAVFVGCGFVLSMVQSFWSIFTNKYLADIHAPAPSAVQTLAQWGEIVCMALMPLAFRRLGVKRMMLLGLMGWLVRNGIFAVGTMPVAVVCGLPLHGLSFCFFYITAQLVMDQLAPPHLRASAQAIWVFFTSGLGTLAGNLLASRVVSAHTDAGAIDWGAVWAVPFLMTAGIIVTFALGFRGDGERKPAPVEPVEPLPPPSPLARDKRAAVVTATRV